ncbi:MAG TPA: hypothetical protein VF466_00875 [Candidatus Saccharimonadales bacterium]
MPYGPTGPAGVEQSNPAVPLFDRFTETSVDYPQNLIGVTADVGLTALTLIDDEQLSWDAFIASELAGPDLAAVVARTTQEHERVGFHGNDRLAAILPGVYQATKDNIVSSVAALSHGPYWLWTTEPASPIEISDAEVFLLTHPDAVANRAAVRGLFQAASTALHETGGMPQVYATLYKEALLGRSSSMFPNARSVKIENKRMTLAGKLRPYLRAAIRPVALSHGLSKAQAAAFAYNISRP